jgi:hypothetical protein
MARGETPARTADLGIVESEGARDPSCSSIGEDEPYNGPLAVSSAWENGTEASPHEATRWPSAGQAGGDLQNFHHGDGARDGVVRACLLDLIANTVGANQQLDKSQIEEYHIHISLSLHY